MIMVFQSDLLNLLRRHFAARCSYIVPKTDPNYMSIRLLVERSGLSQQKIRAILVKDSRVPTLSEFDAILQGLRISVIDLLPKSEPISDKRRDARTSSLESELATIWAAADSLITGIDMPARRCLVKAGEIQRAVEHIAAQYNVLRPKKKRSKKLLPAY